MPEKEKQPAKPGGPVKRALRKVVERAKTTPRKQRKANASTADNRVGLKPKNGWHKRNFVSEVFIPSVFQKRTGAHLPPAFADLKGDDICITWIGHASFLVRTHGMNILIDPNWAKWLKIVKRVRHPGLHLHDLPNIDLVLITHAHFDHLDRKTLRMVAEEQPIAVPVGVGNLVHDLGFNKVHELDDWGTFSHGPLEITMTPCAHWGARMLHDAHRGFGGFLIKAGGRSVFHCGDSAYFEGFKEIGKRFDIDVALLPIGAYDPPSGREVHMNPEEAAQTFIDLDARTLVPMHYGTFRLSYEPVHEPPERLMACAEKFGIAEKVSILTEGESVVF